MHREYHKASAQQALFLRALDGVTKSRQLEVKPSFGGLRRDHSELFAELSNLFSSQNVCIDEFEDQKLTQALKHYDHFLKYLTDVLVAHLMLKKGQLVTYSFIILKSISKFTRFKHFLIDFFDQFAVNTLKYCLDMIANMRQKRGYCCANCIFPVLIPVYNFLQFVTQTGPADLSYFQITCVLLQKFKEPLRQFPAIVGLIDSVVSFYGGASPRLLMSRHMLGSYNKFTLFSSQLYCKDLDLYKIEDKTWTHLLSSGRMYFQQVSRKWAHAWLTVGNESCLTFSPSQKSTTKVSLTRSHRGCQTEDVFGPVQIGPALDQAQRFDG